MELVLSWSHMLFQWNKILVRFFIKILIFQKIVLDSKVILSQEENLKNAEKRKILVVLGNQINSQPTQRRRDFTLNEIGDSVVNLHSQLEQLRKLVYLLIFLILFLILITGCSLIIEKKKLRSEL